MTDRAETGSSRAMDFISAFNEIETFLRVELSAKRSDSFWWMVDKAASKHWLSSDQAAVLKDYGNLRNAISHGKFNDGKPIAEPFQETVDSINHIKSLLLDPPLALSVLEDQEVITLHPDDLITHLFELIRAKDVSQFPVYSDGHFVTLLTMNALTRWVAEYFADIPKDARVHDTIKYIKKHEQAVFLPRTVSAQEAYDALAIPNKRGQTPRAIVITESGSKDQQPLRVISPRDLPALLSNL